MLSTDPSPRNLAIIRLSSFGDVVLTEPVARCIKERYPGCRLWFVTGKAYTEIPRLFNSVDGVVSYGKREASPELEDLVAGTKLDVVVDLQANLRSRRLCRLMKPGRLLRHCRPRFRRFLAVHLPWIWKGHLKHVVETYFEAVRQLDVECQDLAPRIRLPAELTDRSAVAAKDGPWVAVCPGGSSQHKMWGEHRFARLIGLLESQGQKVVLVGSEHDRAVIESIRSELGKPELPALIGNQVRKTAGLLSVCRVTVSNDSGLMHLAGAVGSQVVALFGPTSPILGFSPLTPGSVVVSLNLPCSPCSFHGTKPCKYRHRRCLDGIEPQAVADVVQDILG